MPCFIMQYSHMQKARSLCPALMSVSYLCGIAFTF